MNRALGWAWIALTAALALHAANEAMNGFVETFNGNASWVRDRTSVAVPALTIRGFVWFHAAIVAALLALSAPAFRGQKGMRRGATVFAGVMLVNGANHLLQSAVWRRAMPGVYTSPLLIAGAAFLWHVVRRERGRRGPGASETDHPRI